MNGGKVRKMLRVGRARVKEKQLNSYTVKLGLDRGCAMRSVASEAGYDDVAHL